LNITAAALLVRTFWIADSPPSSSSSTIMISPRHRNNVVVPFGAPPVGVGVPARPPLPSPRSPRSPPVLSSVPAPQPSPRAETNDDDAAMNGRVFVVQLVAPLQLINIDYNNNIEAKYTNNNNNECTIIATTPHRRDNGDDDPLPQPLFSTLISSPPPPPPPLPSTEISRSSAPSAIESTNI
jgi:hypothetical protein